MPIDPAMLTQSTEWSMPTVDAPPNADPAGGGASFGSMLAKQVGDLQATQDQAGAASEALATGQATDPTSVVMAVERARLSMQLASTIRTKAVESINDIFHTQV